jgi:DNA-binding NarL/FixJ family response regulator
LVVSRRTVEKHVEHIYGKLGVGSRAAAAARAYSTARRAIHLT